MTDAELRGVDSEGLVHFVWSDEYDICYVRCARFVKLDIVRRSDEIVTCFECLLLEIQ